MDSPLTPVRMLENGYSEPDTKLAYRQVLILIK